MATHEITLMQIFAIARIQFPERINSTVSKLKVEKVLNPPQNPVISSNRIIPKLVFELIVKTTIASIAELKIFDISVEVGKEFSALFFSKYEMKYLAKLPNPPPINTST